MEDAVLEQSRVKIDGTMESGIYFDLPEDQYHAAPALSNSGIKWLKVSPLDFWVRSWMNPDYKNETSSFMEEGNAWHKRVLEGKKAFEAAYAPTLDKADFPDALVTAEDLKRTCEENGLPKGGNKDTLIKHLIETRIPVRIWDKLVEGHRATHVGKVLLPFDVIKRIELQAAMIEKHPDLSRCFSGGYPEISIFYEDEATGVPMKARLDYLKPLAIVDLKTFSNKLAKPIDRAVTGEIAARKYHIQVAKYWMALRRALSFIKERRVFGEVDPDWLKTLAAADENIRQFVFVFQQTGIAPVARPYVFPRLLSYDAAKSEIRSAVLNFANCWHIFRTDPWVDLTPIRQLDDAEFPAYMTTDY